MPSSRKRSEPSWVPAFARHIHAGQFARYLLVGLWNTVFGYVCFAGFTALLEKAVPQSYLAGSLLANLVSITVAFLGYKWFVFRTKGNYLREWLRCLGVYSGSIALGLALLPLMVVAIRRNFGYQKEAPYIAGALLTCITVIMSFFGHKHFSFRPYQLERLKGETPESALK
jgi:putative flippase GtrA